MVKVEDVMCQSRSECGDVAGSHNNECLGTIVVLRVVKDDVPRQAVTVE